MSLVAYRKDVKRPVASGRIDWAPIGFHTLVGVVRKAVVKSVTMLVHFIDAVAEARIQRAASEVELYRNRYKHSSKNDDDLPIVH